MKRCLPIVLILMLFTGLLSCTDLTAYNLEDFIPPLMDTETQYPYVEKIVVARLETDDSVELTEWADHNNVRMQFEEQKCVRRESTKEITEGFSVTFYTTDGEVAVLIPVEADAYQADYVYIDGYEFEMLANGVDTFYFESLLAE